MIKQIKTYDYQIKLGFEVEIYRLRRLPECYQIMQSLKATLRLSVCHNPPIVHNQNIGVGFHFSQVDRFVLPIQQGRGHRARAAHR